MYLIAEYCGALYYTGWHLYLRDSQLMNKRNSDGNWGWIRRPKENGMVTDFFSTLGIFFKGDGTCHHDGIAQFAKQFPLKGKRCGGRIRGGVEVHIVNGKIEVEKQAEKELKK